MSHDYIDRSRIVYEDLADDELRISVLKNQTGRAIDEATAKNLLSQVRLNNALTKFVPGTPEFLDILRKLSDLNNIWEELNTLKRKVLET